jgi:hypothetical protein
VVGRPRLLWHKVSQDLPNHEVRNAVIDKQADSFRVAGARLEATKGLGNPSLSPHYGLNVCHRALVASPALPGRVRTGFPRADFTDSIKTRSRDQFDRLKGEGGLGLDRRCRAGVAAGWLAVGGQDRRSGAACPKRLTNPFPAGTTLQNRTKLGAGTKYIMDRARAAWGSIGGAASALRLPGSRSAGGRERGMLGNESRTGFPRTDLTDSIKTRCSPLPSTSSKPQSPPLLVGDAPPPPPPHRGGGGPRPYQTAAKPPPPPNVRKCAPQNALDRILTSSDALLHASNAGANPSTMTRSVPAASRLWQNRAQPTPMIAVHVCGAGGTEHQDRGQTPDGGWDGIGKGALGCP